MRIAANGYCAGVIQHEADHLSGLLFLDRLKSTKDLGYNEEWTQHMAEDNGICWKGSAKFFEGAAF
jgi:peptide deformylase